MSIEGYITVIVALITAIAAILAPIVSALISQRGAYRVKLAELFFLAKVGAYRNFICAASNLPHRPTTDELMELQSESAQAMLFSSNETQSELGVYGTLLVEFTRRVEVTSKDIDALSKAHRKAILAMRAELERYQHK